MWITVAGFDYTLNIPFDTIELDQSISDRLPSFKCDIDDPGSQFNFNILDEMVVWDENALPGINSAGLQVASTPAHNLIQTLDQSGSGQTGAWATGGSISAIISSFPGLTPVMTFNNTTYSGGNNTARLTAISPAGYMHAGQQYMFSAYATIPSILTNAQAWIQMQFLDNQANTIGSPTIGTIFTTTAGTIRLSVSATAPSTAVYAQVWLFGQATTSGTNSGSITWSYPQLEPMWFTDLNQSYPTNDCNYYQANCSQMPDLTMSRTARVFSGYIDDFQVEYDGRNRVWHITANGPGALLENGLINATYTDTPDNSIISSLISNYFPNQITITAPNNLTPIPIVQGAEIDSISFGDNTLRECLNDLANESAFDFYLDPYYRLWYTPSYFNTAPFSLTDGIADNINSFNYYNYLYEQDGTQMKRRIKINGGQFTGHWQDTFSGDGSTKQFTLTWLPDKLVLVTVGGSKQKVGVYRRDNFTTGSLQAVLNKQNQYILFKNAPASGSNNIEVDYTYHAPITSQTWMQGIPGSTPSYVIPYFDSKIDDTNLVSLNAATQRGLAEITKKGNPLQIIQAYCNQFAQAGTTLFFTSTLDNLIDQAFQIQQITGKCLGYGINEYQYKLGAYSPTLIDHMRNVHKAVRRSATVANATAVQQIDVVALDLIEYGDTLSGTPQTAYPTCIYGTGVYGASAWGGTTGLYGSTAIWGSGTTYG